MTNSSSDQAKTPTLEISVMPVTAFQQNCSLLICTQTRKAALVDPGGEAEKLIAAVDEADATLEQVLLTHGHIDHIGGAADVAAHFGVPIVGPHRADEQLIQGVATQAAMFGTPGVKVPSIDRWLEGGDTVSVGDLTFDVLFTPGHAPGHVIFVDHAHKFIVMGDVLFAGVGRAHRSARLRPWRADEARSSRRFCRWAMTISFCPATGRGARLGPSGRRTSSRSA
jgi:hydroxyacylglutathione hydrolase